MSKHTPGPFEIKKDSFDDSFYLRCKGAEKGNGFVVERIVAKGIDSRADAKLFAVAPDLLEALSLAVADVERGFPFGIDGEWLPQAKAAIARAKGESQ